MTTLGLNRPATVYIAALALAALAVLLGAASQLNHSVAPVLLLFALARTTFDLWEVRLVRGTTFSLANAVVIMALLLHGVFFAVWVGALSELTIHLRHSFRLAKVVFNVSQLVIRLFIAGVVLALLGGKSGPDFDAPLQALVVCAADVVINIVLLGLLFSLMQRRPFLAVLREGNWSDTYQLAYVGPALGIAAAMFWQRGGWPAVAVIFAVLGMLQFSLQRYTAALHDATSGREQLEAVLNATKSAIVVVDDTNAVRLVNQTFGEMFGVDPGAVVGRTLDEIPASPAVQALQRANAEAADPAGRASQAVLLLEAGTRRYLNWYRAPVHIPGGGEQGKLDVFTDVTLEKAAEERLRKVHRGTLLALTAAIDARDPYTHGHSTRVAQYSQVIGRRLGLPEEKIEMLGYAGLLHDIGKLGVDDQVLRKHGPLTPTERAAMMEHTVIGANILEAAGVFTELIPVVRWHHEWLNGGGYPDGLKGEEIPLEARIVGTADALDAMTSDRPYRGALPPEEALFRLSASRGTQFDPSCVDATVAAVAAGEIDLSRSQAEQKDAADESLTGVIRPYHSKELSIMYQISQESFSQLSLKSMLRRFLEIFYDTLGPHVYIIALCDEETGDLVVHSCLGFSGELEGMAFPRGRGIPGRAAASGKPVLVNNVLEAADYVPLVPATRSQLCVPLAWKGAVIGVLSVESTRVGAFSRDDEALYQALARQVASGIELARHQERLAYAAARDGLTGVYNHSHFYHRLTVALTDAQRLGEPVSLVLADINGLKAVNDNFGHLAGDAIIKKYAEVFRHHTRESADVVARYGGDEFAIIMPGTSRRQALRLVERLQSSAEKYLHFEGRMLPLPRAAYGVATFPEDGQRPTELVNVADRAMYADKPARRRLHSIRP